MQDIADALGISKTTVSTAISDKYGVSDSKRSEIIFTAIQMGYDFKKSKIGTKSKKGEIAVLFGQNDFMQSYFWLPILRGVEKEAAERGYRFRIVLTCQYDSIEELTVTLAGPKLAGIILLSDGDTALAEQLFKLNIPMALADSREISDARFDHVRASNYAGGIMAAKYLMEHGHTHMAFGGNKDFSYSFRQRANGFRDAVESAGLRYTAVGEDRSDPSDPVVREEIERVFLSPDAPTALFCANDDWACMAYYVLKGVGLSVPDDVSLIGFDNIDTSKYVRDQAFSLTTFDVPKELMGRKVVHLLAERIERGGAPESIEIAAVLVERGSVKDLTKRQ